MSITSQYSRKITATAHTSLPRSLSSNSLICWTHIWNSVIKAQPSIKLCMIRESLPGVGSFALYLLGISRCSAWWKGWALLGQEGWEVSCRMVEWKCCSFLCLCVCSKWRGIVVKNDQRNAYRLTWTPKHFLIEFKYILEIECWTRSFVHKFIYDCTEHKLSIWASRTDYLRVCLFALRLFLVAWNIQHLNPPRPIKVSLPLRCL